MSDRFSLIKPAVEYERSYKSYIDELGDAERYPFPLDYGYDDFAALVARLNDFSLGTGLTDDMVPNTTFWLIENGEIVGVSNLRHRLTERKSASAEALSPAEELRLDMWIFRQLNTWELAFARYQDGLMDQTDWSEWSGTFSANILPLLSREKWNQSKVGYGKDFVKHVDAVYADE